LLSRADFYHCLLKNKHEHIKQDISEDRTKDVYYHYPASTYCIQYRQSHLKQGMISFAVVLKIQQEGVKKNVTGKIQGSF